MRPGGPVLDVACGGGRHTRLFLERGHPVAAVDRDVSGLAKIAGKDLAVRPGLEIVEADLEDGSPWPLPGRRFAGIVVTNYLYRPLLRRLADTLEEGGLLIYETFAQGNHRYGKPASPDFLLRPGELLETYAGSLHVLAFEQGLVERPKPALIQRIAAVRLPPARAVAVPLFPQQ